MKLYFDYGLPFAEIELINGYFKTGKSLDKCKRNDLNINGFRVEYKWDKEPVPLSQKCMPQYSTA